MLKKNMQLTKIAFFLFLMFGLVISMTARLKRQYNQRHPQQLRKRPMVNKRQRRRPVARYQMPSPIAPWDNIDYAT